MYRILDENEIKEFQSKYDFLKLFVIKKVSVITYGGISEYLINNECLFKVNHKSMI